MAAITITIPDGSVARVVDGVCNFNGYVSNKNPGETKAQFARRMIVDYIKTCVKHTEDAVEMETARVAHQANYTDIDTIVGT